MAGLDPTMTLQQRCNSVYITFLFLLVGRLNAGYDKNGTLQRSQSGAAGSLAAYEGLLTPFKVLRHLPQVSRQDRGDP